MEKIKAYLTGQIIFSNDAEAFSLLEKSSFGEEVNGKVQYSFSEALYLVEKNKMEVSVSNKPIEKKELTRKLYNLDKRLYIKYPVFRDLKEKGYIVKSALKFGADFRVYDKGQKIGKHHSRWIVFVDHETSKITWNEFSAKNRVAHSTKKKLLLAIVDEESDVTYYEVDWMKV